MLPRLLGCLRTRPSRLSLLCIVSLFLVSTILLGFRMHYKSYLSAALYALPALAVPSSSSTAAPAASSSASASADPFRAYTIRTENITASFIPYGARLTSLLVPDRHGQQQDVVVGYDKGSDYVHDTETDHTYFGAVVGRYANRIKNGTFTVNSDSASGSSRYHVPENENGGIDTLHGGNIGYDQRNWTVTAHTYSSVTFTLYDHAWQHFPGDVVTHAVYSVDNARTPDNPDGLPRLTTKLVSLALSSTTPIMLSNHIYWNLNGFKQPTVLNDTFLQLPLSPRLIATDGILIPNGTILDASTAYRGSADFTKGKLVGKDISKTSGLCGTGCTGYDNCFIVDRPASYAASDSLVPTVYMESKTTGISLDVSTNQQAVQIYSCNGQKGNIPVKPSQVKRNDKEGVKRGAKTVNKHGCVVIEPEGWIDGINHPEWGQLGDQVYSASSGPAVNWATYKFGTF